MQCTVEMRAVNSASRQAHVRQTVFRQEAVFQALFENGKPRLLQQKRRDENQAMNLLCVESCRTSFVCFVCTACLRKHQDNAETSAFNTVLPEWNATCPALAACFF